VEVTISQKELVIASISKEETIFREEVISQAAPQ
jgi:hypothetical protein